VKVARPVLRGPGRSNALGLPDQVSHTTRAAVASFDDPNLVSAAGLLPVMRLAERAGLRSLADQWLSVPTDKGAHAGSKVESLVAGMVAGADSIDDMGLLHHGGMKKIFTSCYAPSTLGSFLRSFTFGHVRQLDAVASRLLVNLAEQAPLVPAPADHGLVFVDVDDTFQSKCTGIRNKVLGLDTPEFAASTRSWPLCPRRRAHR
jgi:hypothetical protein